MSTEPVYLPGDMERMFARIEKEFSAQFNVTVLSRSPWVVTFDNFMTKEEADAIISTQTKWERSTDTGTMNAFGETVLELPLSSFLPSLFIFLIRVECCLRVERPPTAGVTRPVCLTRS